MTHDDDIPIVVFKTHDLVLLRRSMHTPDNYSVNTLIEATKHIIAEVESKAQTIH